MDDIALQLNISYRTLARRFRSETGISIVEKLNFIRINRAKQLLLTTKTSIIDIAASSGFENEYYFSKKFKEQERISPSQYRKKTQPHIAVK